MTFFYSECLLFAHTENKVIYNNIYKILKDTYKYEFVKILFLIQ